MKLRGVQLSVWRDRYSLSTNQGFTLLELLIAIAISGILVAIVVPSFLNLVDQTKINLLAEQIRQSLKEGQWLAISEGQSYSVYFKKTPQGLQVGYAPAAEPDSQGIASNGTSPPEPESWRNLSSSIPPEQLVFTIPGPSNNKITFLPEGEIEFPSLVFIAMGTSEHPRVNTRRCISVNNSESGGSYFQVDKDLACNLSPNISPTQVDGSPSSLN